MNALNLFSGRSFSGSKALTTLSLVFCLCCFKTQATATHPLSKTSTLTAFAYSEVDALQIVQTDGKTYRVDVPYSYFSISRRRWIKMEISFFVTVRNKSLTYNRIRQEIKNFCKTASISSIAKAIISGRKAGFVTLQVKVVEFLFQKLSERVGLRIKINRR